MKRLGAILTLAALIITLSASFCFADSLTIDETYPKDGSTGAAIENLGVKIYFNGELTEKTVGEANEKAFQLYDDEGSKLPTRVLYSDKEKGVVLVLLDNTGKKKVTVKGNTEYTLKISGDLVDDKGNTLGKDREITFKTLNQNTNMMISMGMMVVMFGGMFVITSRSAKKATEEVKREEKVNPYKEAKKTGKSVEEIVEKDKKKKAKEAAKAAKEAAENETDDYDEDDDINKYRVSRRHSASEAGCRYVAKKKEAAQKAKAKSSKNKTASKGKKKKK